VKRLGRELKDTILNKKKRPLISTTIPAILIMIIKDRSKITIPTLLTKIKDIFWKQQFEHLNIFNYNNKTNIHSENKLLEPKNFNNIYKLTKYHHK